MDSLELIPDEISRRRRFYKRIEGLKKKAFELQELCGIDTLLISYDQQGQHRTWPEAPADVGRIIHRYYSTSETARKRYSQSPHDFKTKNKSPQEQSNPAHDGRQLDGLLKKLAEEDRALDDKINAITEKIESIKASTKQKEESESAISHPRSHPSDISRAPAADFNRPVAVNPVSRSDRLVSMQRRTGFPYYCNYDNFGPVNLSEPPAFGADCLRANNFLSDASMAGFPYVVGPCDPSSSLKLPSVSNGAIASNHDGLLGCNVAGSSHLIGPSHPSYLLLPNYSNVANASNHDGLLDSIIGSSSYMVGSSDPSSSLQQLPNSWNDADASHEGQLSSIVGSSVPSSSLQLPTTGFIDVNAFNHGLLLGSGVGPSHVVNPTFLKLPNISSTKPHGRASGPSDEKHLEFVGSRSMERGWPSRFGM